MKLGAAKCCEGICAYMGWREVLGPGRSEEWDATEVLAGELVTLGFVPVVVDVGVHVELRMHTVK